MPSTQVATEETEMAATLYLESVLDCALAVQDYGINHPDKNGAHSIGQREAAHRQAQCHSPLNGRQPIFALLGYEDIRTLEGRLLTLVDASFSDQTQRKAFKDMLRRELWFNWVRFLDTDDPSGGIPNR